MIEGLGTLRNRVVSKPIPGHKNFPARKVPGAPAPPPETR